VGANVVEGPKIKCSFHRLLVMLSEERLDVRCEAQAVVFRRRIHPTQISASERPAHPAHGVGGVTDLPSPPAAREPVLSAAPPRIWVDGMAVDRSVLRQMPIDAQGATVHSWQPMTSLLTYPLDSFSIRT
jgi:hypothetical protein